MGITLEAYLIMHSSIINLGQLNLNIMRDVIPHSNKWFPTKK